MPAEREKYMESWEEGGKDTAPKTVPFIQEKDFVKGTYCLKQTGVRTDYGDTTVYQLKLHVGSWHVKDKTTKQIEKVDGQPGEFVSIFAKDQIDDLFAKCKLGEIVSIQLVELKDTGKASPWKRFRTRQYGIDKEWSGEDSTAIQDVFPDAEQVEGSPV